MPTENSSNFPPSNQNRNNKTMLLGGFHNPLLLEFLKTQCPRNLILTGDFNRPETSWETHQSAYDYGKTVINFAIHSNLEQHVNFYTIASSRLDLVFTSNDTLMNSVRTETFSDHNPVEIQMSLNEKTRKTDRVEYYNYCKRNFDEMVAEMKSNLFQAYCYSKIDVNTNLWYKWPVELNDRFTSKRTRKRQGYPHWFSNETYHQLNQLKTERRRTLKKGNSTSDKLSRLTATCEYMQDKDREQYEKALFCLMKLPKNFQVSQKSSKRQPTTCNKI